MNEELLKKYIEARAAYQVALDEFVALDTQMREINAKWREATNGGAPMYQLQREMDEAGRRLLASLA